MKDFDGYGEKVEKAMDGGLIAISIILLQGVLSVSPIDVALTVAIIALSVAIPTLVFTLLLRMVWSVSSIPEVKRRNSHAVLMLTGYIAAIVAIDAAIWHVLWIAGVVFLILGATSFYIYVAFDREVKDLLEKEDTKKS